MRLYFITNKPHLAKHAWQSGVDRVFIDLEYIGKEERQPGFQRVISHHHIADIAAIHALCPEATLLARINPIHENTQGEIDSCLAAGASVIMLPMFRSASEVQYVGAYINRRAVFCPLIETWEAVASIKEYVALPVADEFHFGLTDLSLAKGYPFVFQPWAEGLLETAFAVLRDSGKPFGVGGVARVGEGLVPGEMVMGEHARVGSTGAMLSQAFHHRISDLDQLKARMNFSQELTKLRQAFDNFHSGLIIAVQNNRYEFIRGCTMIGRQMSGLA